MLRKVRLANKEDIEGIINLIKNIPEEYSLEKLATFDYDTTYNTILRALEKNLCFLTEGPKEIESVMILSVTSTWWGKEEHITNEILYAKEGKFKKDTLKEYLKIFQDIADINNLPGMFTMLNYHYNGKDDISKKEKLFEKMIKDSKKVGSSLMYTPSTENNEKG